MDEPKPIMTLSGPCDCVHMACTHARGKCPERPLIIAKQLGTLARLCAVCADRGGLLGPEQSA
jgi:hypothetical protein